MFIPCVFLSFSPLPRSVLELCDNLCVCVCVCLRAPFCHPLHGRTLSRQKEGIVGKGRSIERVCTPFLHSLLTAITGLFSSSFPSLRPCQSSPQKRCPGISPFLSLNSSFSTSSCPTSLLFMLVLFVPVSSPSSLVITPHLNLADATLHSALRHLCFRFLGKGFLYTGGGLPP